MKTESSSVSSFCLACDLLQQQKTTSYNLVKLPPLFNFLPTNSYCPSAQCIRVKAPHPSRSSHSTQVRGHPKVLKPWVPQTTISVRLQWSFNWLRLQCMDDDQHNIADKRAPPYVWAVSGSQLTAWRELHAGKRGKGLETDPYQNEYLLQLSMSTLWTVNTRTHNQLTSHHFFLSASTAYQGQSGRAGSCTTFGRRQL